MITESQNEKTLNIDRLSSHEIITLINQEDLTVAQTVQQAIPQISMAVDVMVTGLKQGGRIFYIGAGTSGRLGVLDAVECVPTFGTSPDVFQALIAGGSNAFIAAQEGAEDDAVAGKNDLKSKTLTETDIVIGLAASGRTPYVLGGIEYAKGIGAKTIGISCNSPAKLLDVADYPIAIPVGSEVIAGSTRMKAGTAQKMVLNMLSSASMIKMGKVYKNLMVDVVITNDKLARRARDIVAQLTDLPTEEADTLLKSANNHVKSAVVMHAKGLDYNAAQQLLQEHHGYLQSILEDA